MRAKSQTATKTVPLESEDSSRAPAHRCSMLHPPSASSRASFAPEFGKRFLLTIDTEEEFDWNAPFTRSDHGLSHVAAIPRFQAFCESLSAHPIYLVDWPIAADAAAVEIISDAITRGKADIGVQLHPWVSPPFEEDLGIYNSFAGNLPRELEQAKFMALRDRIEEAFGTAPLIYRAGRYGLGPHTADILKAGGIKIDTSVRPLFDYSAHGGPDYFDHPTTPYWVDQERELLEAPLSVVHAGALRKVGGGLQKAGGGLPPLLGALSRLGLLERIALTPEGVSIDEALRALELTIASNLPLTVLSFHSPSLAPGLTPYTNSQGEVEAIYEWFTRVFERLFAANIRSASVEEVLSAAQN